MRKLIVFNNVTLDGYFADPHGDIGWAHANHEDVEWSTFITDNANTGGLLLFGRITYQLVASYWPTPCAMANDPMVAERMNNLPKIVFSRTLEKTTWNNTRLVNGDIAAEIRKIKRENEMDMVVFGSGSIVSQLAQNDLVDQYQLVINPIVLGKGKTMFDGIKKNLGLRLIQTRSFHNGNVLLCYEPIT